MATVGETVKKKLEKKEVEKLSKLYNSYQKVTLELGQIELQLNSLQDRKNKILIENKKLIIEEQKIVKELNKKYGEGVVDPSDWSFIPNSKK